MKFKIRFSKTEILIFLSLFMAISIRNFGWFSVYFYMIPAFILLLKYLSRRGISIQKENAQFIAPFMLFLMFSLLSFLWAARPQYVLSTGFIIARIYVVVAIYLLYVNNVGDLEKHIFLLYIAGVLMLVNLFVSTPFGVWKECLVGSFSASTDEGRLGRTIGYHPNELGHICVLLALISVYLRSIKGRKIYTVLAFMFTFVTFFTKSRTSLVMLVVMIGLYYITAEERARRQIVAILSSIVLLIVSYWAVFNIPVLYQLVGFRFAGVFGSASAQDASTVVRLRFLNYAFDLFRSHPILGVGLDNFKYYAYSGLNAWKEVYSHSNWGELLSCTGLVGTGLYYGPQIAALISLARSLRHLDGNNRKLCAFLFSFLLVTILFDVQKISYQKLYIVYPIGMAVIGAVYLKQMGYKQK